MSPPTTADFQRELDCIFRVARDQHLSHIDIVSGELHREIGGYPGTDHRMPACCNVMRSNMQAGDEVLYSPPKGRGQH